MLQTPRRGAPTRPRPARSAHSAAMRRRVHHQRVQQAVAARGGAGELPQLALGHAGVMLQRHRGNALALIKVAHTADEGRAGAVTAGRQMRLMFGEFLPRRERARANFHFHRTPRSTTGDRRKECDFIAVLHRLLQIGVFQIARAHRFSGGGSSLSARQASPMVMPRRCASSVCPIPSCWRRLAKHLMRTLIRALPAKNGG